MSKFQPRSLRWGSFIIFLVWPRITVAQMSFIAIGDWGRPGASLSATAQAMAEIGARMPSVSHVITLGDNFYSNGVRSDVDPHWKTSFEDQFWHPSLQVPFYPILGNHDWYGSASAQIDRFYSHKSARWVMPNYYYATLHTFPASEQSSFWSLPESQERYVSHAVLATVFIDSWTIIKPVFSGLTSTTRVRQLHWLQETLRSVRKTADWVVVIGHHPIFSSGYHGDNSVMIEHVLPILRDHGVDVYISGHDHDMEVLVDRRDEQEGQDDGGGTKEGKRALRFVVCGSAAMSRSIKEFSAPKSKFASAENGFGHFLVTDKEMIVTLVDNAGLTRYTHSLTREALHGRESGSRLDIGSDDVDIKNSTSYPTVEQRVLESDEARACPLSPRVYTYIGTWNFPHFSEMMAMVNNFYDAAAAARSRTQFDPGRDNTGNEGIFVIPVPPKTDIPHICLLNNVDRDHMHPASISEGAGMILGGRSVISAAFYFFLALFLLFLLFWVCRGGIKAIQIWQDQKEDQSRPNPHRDLEMATTYRGGSTVAYSHIHNGSKLSTSRKY